MEKLMKPAEYAKELGISRQAVYAKIKRGMLTAKSVDGKLYIVVDTQATPHKSISGKEEEKVRVEKSASEEHGEGAQKFRALLQAKDETIAVLKETVKDLKESNREISTTLRGEIDLLKEAFHEMRTLYRHRLEHVREEAIDIGEHDASVSVPSAEALQGETNWIGIKKFLRQQGITKEKQQKKVIKRLKKAYKKGDERLSGEKGKVKINSEASYGDILS